MYRYIPCFEYEMKILLKPILLIVMKNMILDRTGQAHDNHLLKSMKNIRLMSILYNW